MPTIDFRQVNETKLLHNQVNKDETIFVMKRPIGEYLVSRPIRTHRTENYHLDT